MKGIFIDLHKFVNCFGHVRRHTTGHIDLDCDNAGEVLLWSITGRLPPRGPANG